MNVAEYREKLERYNKMIDDGSWSLPEGREFARKLGDMVKKQDEEIAHAVQDELYQKRINP
jgi:hypothetical protein